MCLNEAFCLHLEYNRCNTAGLSLLTEKNELHLTLLRVSASLKRLKAIHSAAISVGFDRQSWWYPSVVHIAFAWEQGETPYSCKRNQHKLFIKIMVENGEAGRAPLKAAKKRIDQ